MTARFIVHAMPYQPDTLTNHFCRPSWICIGLLTLLLCSCRSLTPLTQWSLTSVTALENTANQPTQVASAAVDGTNQATAGTGSASSSTTAPAAPTPPAPTPPAATPPAAKAPLPTAPVRLPASAWSGYPPHPATVRIPATGGRGQTWSPPGLPRPWPPDEYVFDGGDRAGKVNVALDWSVDGLDEEDTIVHYETRQGKTIIQPTNRVSVYAPRFAAIRRVDGIIQNHHSFSRLMNHQFEALRLDKDIQNQKRITQELQPGRHLALTTPNGFRERLPDRTFDNVQNARGTNGAYDLYEDFAIIRRGVFDINEKARLNQRIEAAKTWTTEQGVQVVLDDKLPVEFSNDRSSALYSVYQMPEGKKRLRVVKIASQQQAHSGDIIEFTIRFDNTGEETVGNVTVIDNLTPRLEYVDGSQSSSLKSNFATQVNEGLSLVLRWEIIDPLKVGEGGVIRFKCRVR